jgi:hypothetical protein
MLSSRYGNTTVWLMNYALSPHWTCQRDLAAAAASIANGDPLMAITRWLLSRAER